MSKTKPPTAPKFARGGLSPLLPEQLESESIYRGRVLEGVSLDGLNLQATSFEGCVFREVNLSGVRWERVRLADVRFEGCDLSNAQLLEAGLERVQLTDCRLMGLSVLAGRLRHVRLTRAQAHLSQWTKLDAQHLWFEEADLSEADFYEASLPNAVFRHCNLHKAEFHKAALSGADLRGSALKNTRIGLREVAGITVDALQLLDLAHLLEVTVQELETEKA